MRFVFVQVYIILSSLTYFFLRFKLQIDRLCFNLGVMILSSIKIENLSYAYQNEQIFQGASLLIHPGEIVGVFGPSGVGKSTLLQLIRGNLTPLSGHIQCKAEMTLLSQDLALLPNLTPVENCLLPALFKKMDAKDVEQKAHRYLRALDLQDIIEKPCKQLSRGQMQRVSLARTFCLDAPVTLLDEPTTALDFGSDQKALELLKSWHRPEKIIVLVSHKPHITAWCNRAIQVDKMVLKDVPLSTHGEQR